MYLSKIDLDLAKTGVRRDLGDYHRLHQQIMLGFPVLRETLDNSRDQKNECRKEWQILYRLEGAMLLVQSGIEPNWGRLSEGYTPEAVRELDFQTLQIGELLKFRLLANPVKQRTCIRQDSDGQPILKKDGSGKPQRKTMRWLITKEKEQIEWLADHLKGADLAECYASAPGKLKAKSKGVTIQAVQFDGSLQVNDVSEFLNVLRQGIGRGRSYGCGLLSIARIRG